MNKLRKAIARSLWQDEIAAIVRTAGIEPVSSGALDEMDVSPAMRRAGAIIVAEYQEEVESEALAERVYWVMRTVRLGEIRSSGSG